MILEATNIVKTYTKLQAKTPVLKNVNLSVFPGELLVIVGRSGAGKSTLLHILGSIDKPDSGTIRLNIDGKEYAYPEMNNAQTATFRNRNIGFVFQFHHLLPEFTALENIMLPAMVAGDTYKVAAEKAKQLLKIVDLDIRETHKPNELSGGEQQRVAIARALINKPKIVFADEPTGNLDRANSLNVLDIIARLKQETEITFVVATHSDDVAARATRVVTVKDGMIEN